MPRIKRRQQNTSSKVAKKIILLKTNEGRTGAVRRRHAAVPRKIILQKRSHKIGALNIQRKSDRAVRLKTGNGTAALNRRIGNRPLTAVDTGLRPTPITNFGSKMCPGCASISRPTLLMWTATIVRTWLPADRCRAVGRPIVAVPTEVITYLPPVPEGYELGFYYGYIIVYDPYSGLVLDVIDLLA